MSGCECGCNCGHCDGLGCECECHALDPIPLCDIKKVLQDEFGFALSTQSKSVLIKWILQQECPMEIVNRCVQAMHLQIMNANVTCTESMLNNIYFEFYDRNGQRISKPHANRAKVKKAPSKAKPKAKAKPKPKAKPKAKASRCTASE